MEEITGRIEHITFTNEQTGYTVARLRIDGYLDQVTAVGNLISPSVGEILRMKGEWSVHPQYGKQFKISQYEKIMPATEAGIENYLGSGFVKGIGPVMAKRIVRTFGMSTLDVIENETQKLSQIEGIGSKRIETIKAAWEAQKGIRDVMLFLQSHGVSHGYAVKIFNEYGSQAVKVVNSNPYRLASDIFGIGFITADKIARKLGFEAGSSLRVEAGIIYVLGELSEEGHVFYPLDLLTEKCMDMLNVEREVIGNALHAIAGEKKIVIEELSDESGKLTSVYLAGYHFCETSTAYRLKALTSAPKSYRDIDASKAIEWVSSHLDIALAEKQRDAVASALRNKVVVITGGPGTGKTTIINAILMILSKLNIEILLAAPTGRAAKRMSEATGQKAQTIHRMLGWNKGGFSRNEDNTLECDLLVVDEASMIDASLMHHMLKAIPAQATLILVGDINQLPSVGAGNVLKDIIDSNIFPVSELNEIFRQSHESRIITNAHKINDGVIPVLSGEKETDFYFIETAEPEKILATIKELVKDRIPGRFGIGSNDIQVLTPMHKGILGAENLNEQIQDLINPGSDEVTRASRRFRVHDKVMQIRNDYTNDVFNGDIGIIERIDKEEQEIAVNFYGRRVAYDFSGLDELVLAYAITVHKSQGSEYPAVIMPVVTQHYMLLQRNLVYTGVTRGKSLVVLVGTKKALAIAVKNNKTQRRYTWLKNRLVAG